MERSEIRKILSKQKKEKVVDLCAQLLDLLSYQKQLEKDDLHYAWVASRLAILKVANLELYSLEELVKL